MNKSKTKEVIKQNAYTYEIINKIKAAGIEVVTDKDEFDKVLVEENIVQKMSDTPKKEEKNPLFLADENELKAFAQKVDDWKAGNLSSNEIITEFTTSTVLQAINVPANKISIEQEVLKKINAPENVKVGKSYGHDIDVEIIKQIPQFLADPVMVYNSATASDSYVIMSETVDKKNRTIMVAMKVNESKGSVVVNDITSSYGRNDNNFYIEQINLGNLVYQNKQKSLEWTHRVGLPLPQRMTTQGSLNVIQKEDIVNKRTPNFNLSERNIEFTENQQEFFKEIGFTNSIDSDGNPINFSFEKKDSKNIKNIFIQKYLNSYTIEEYSCSVTENDSLVYEIKEDEVTHFKPSEIFLLRASSMDMKDNFIIPVETLGKIISDSTLQISRGFISTNYSQMNRMDYYDILKSSSFKNKVSNLPAKFISEDIYSNGINPIGKVLTFKLYKEVLEAAELDLSNYKGNNHFLLEIQTDNNYEKVINKDYPRLYKAKWDRASKGYIDKAEIPLSDLDSKTISNIQYIAANNCNTELAKPVQTMILEDGSVYGFVHKGKIYLNPELMNPNAAVHEYTHLWDAYTQKTNPELWNKGLEMFKETKYWNEVISDPNYQDIRDDDNLVLSEIHSRICGDIVEKVLNRIAELDSEQVKLDAINWNEETWDYISKEMKLSRDYKADMYDKGIFKTDLHSFLSTPLKDLIKERSLSKTKNTDMELNKYMNPTRMELKNWFNQQSIYLTDDQLAVIIDMSCNDTAGRTLVTEDFNRMSIYLHEEFEEPKLLTGESLINFTISELESIIININEHDIRDKLEMEKIVKELKDSLENRGLADKYCTSMQKYGTVEDRLDNAIENIMSLSFDENDSEWDESVRFISIEDKAENFIKLIKVQDLIRNVDVKRPSAEQFLTMLNNGWDYFESINGFRTNVVATDLNKNYEIVDHISEGEGGFLSSDIEAATQADKLGVKIIPQNELFFIHGDSANMYRYVDTEENRKLLSEHLIDNYKHPNLEVYKMLLAVMEKKSGYDITNPVKQNYVKYQIFDQPDEEYQLAMVSGNRLFFTVKLQNDIFNSLADSSEYEWNSYPKHVEDDTEYEMNLVVDLLKASIHSQFLMRSNEYVHRTTVFPANPKLEQKIADALINWCDMEFSKMLTIREKELRIKDEKTLNFENSDFYIDEHESLLFRPDEKFFSASLNMYTEKIIEKTGLLKEGNFYDLSEDARFGIYGELLYYPETDKIFIDIAADEARYEGVDDGTFEVTGSYKEELVKQFQKLVVEQFKKTPDEYIRTFPYVEKYIKEENEFSILPVDLTDFGTKLKNFNNVQKMNGKDYTIKSFISDVSNVAKSENTDKYFSIAKIVIQHIKENDISLYKSLNNHLVESVTKKYDCPTKKDFQKNLKNYLKKEIEKEVAVNQNQGRSD